MDPYGRLAKARQVLAAVSSSLLTAFSEPLAAHLGKDFPHESGVVFAQVFIALSAWTLLAVVFIPMIENFWLYRWLVLGPHRFLEGIWVGVAIPMSSNRVHSHPSMEIMELEWMGEHLRMTGSVYSKEGTRVARFETKYLKIDWPIIYNQVEDLDTGFDQKKEGIGELHFHKSGWRCKTYSGFFGHVGIANNHTIEGVRLTGKETKQLADISTRTQLLNRKYEEITQGLDMSRHASADGHIDAGNSFSLITLVLNL